MGNLTLTQSCKLCPLNANVTALVHLFIVGEMDSLARKLSSCPRPQNENKCILNSPSHRGDRLLARVGDMLLLVLPGVIEDQSAASRVGDNP